MQPKAWSWICVTEIVIYFYSFRIRLIELKINSVCKYFIHSLAYMCVLKWLLNIQAECANREIQWKSSWKLWEKRWGKSRVIPCPSMLCGITHKQRGGKLSSSDETLRWVRMGFSAFVPCSSSPSGCECGKEGLWQMQEPSSYLNSIAVGTFSIKSKRKWSRA